MIDQSPLGLFRKVRRNFGLAAAIRVSFFRLRGALIPALALPPPPAPTGWRDVSILLDAAEHDVATLEGVIDLLADRNRQDWELCIRAHEPLTAEKAEALARWRGAEPWIRVVAAAASVDAVTAAQWTVEQATGRYLALLAPAGAPRFEAFATLLERLRSEPEIKAAALVGGDGAPAGRFGQTGPDCRLLLHRKAEYLAFFQGRWPLAAGSAFVLLQQFGQTAVIPEKTADEISG